MLSFPQMIEWRNRRWRSVVSAMKPTTRSYTLRELLDSLERVRDSGPTPSSYLERLAALVQQDLAIAERFPERRGGPDTRRPWAAWRVRYNRLDRYLGPEVAPQSSAQYLGPDDVSASALSAAENEGWPLPANPPPDFHPARAATHRLATG